MLYLKNAELGYYKLEILVERIFLTWSCSSSDK